MKKIAYCVPTFRNDILLQELLESYMDIFFKYNMDVYIYDSSDNECSRVLVGDYKKHYKNLSYLRFDAKMHSNIKVLKIFQGEGLNEAYDYVWICSDGIRQSKAALELIYNTLMQNECDLLVAGGYNKETGEEVYTDCDKLFLDLAWWMTLYGSTIVNTKTMLKDVNWDNIFELYVNEDCINYSHVAFYFHQLSLLGHINVIHLDSSEPMIYSSILKKKSSWTKNVFSIACDGWKNTINRLPDVYTHRKEVILKLGVYSGAFTLDYLMGLREKGIYNYFVYRKYRKHWNEFCNIRENDLLALAWCPRVYADKFFEWRLRSFCRRYKKVYIYGYGKIAIQMASKLEKENIKFNGFLVSQLPKERKKDKYQVVEFEEQFVLNQRCGIILGMNAIHSMEVLQNITNEKLRKRVLYIY